MGRIPREARRTIAIAEDVTQLAVARDRALSVLVLHRGLKRWLKVALELLADSNFTECSGDGTFYVLKLAALKNIGSARDVLLSTIRSSTLPVKFKRKALAALPLSTSDETLFELACDTQLAPSVRADALATMSLFTLMHKIDWASPRARNLEQLLTCPKDEIGEWEQIETAIWLSFAVLQHAEWRQILRTFVSCCSEDPLNDAIMREPETILEPLICCPEDWRALAHSSRSLKVLRAVLSEEGPSIYFGDLAKLRDVLLAREGDPSPVRESAWTVWKKVANEPADREALVTLCEALGDVSCVGHAPVVHVLDEYGMHFYWANQLIKTAYELLADPATPEANRAALKKLLP